PVMSGRYERRGAAASPQPPGQPGRPRAAASMWESLSAGGDPTAARPRLHHTKPPDAAERPPCAGAGARACPGPPYHHGRQATHPRGQQNRVSVLDDILVDVRADLAARQRATPLEHLKRAAAKAASPRDVTAALRRQGVAVIAEVKRASPSKGALAAIADQIGRASWRG